MENLNKIVYLPIEIKNREFYSKTILAAKLIQKNFKVVIGQQWFIYDQILKNNFPPGIFFQNSLNTYKYSQLRTFKKKQFYNVLLDEEYYSLNFNHYDALFLENISRSYFDDYIDKYYCNTVYELNAMKKNITKNKEKFILTGNVRKEFLEKYSGILDSEAEKLKLKYGKFILINTNFGYINSIFEDYINKLLDDNVISQKAIPEIKKIFSFEEENLQNLLIFLEIALKKFNNINFIIRPHASENIEKVREIYKNLLNYKNFIIDNSGNTHAFIKASLLLIHTSCTTGLEAVYLSKPAINFIPSYLKIYVENILSFEVNKNVFSINDLVSQVELFLSNKDYYKTEFKKDSIPPSDIIAKDLENSCIKWNEKFKIKLNTTYLNYPLKNLKIGTIYKEEVQNIINLVLKENSLKKNYKIHELFDSAFLLY
jgi:surface carbohydrate biosynthesis protein